MTTQGKKSEVAKPDTGLPRCLAIAEAGLLNSQQTIRFLGLAVADVVASRITTGTMHAACNGIGKMLRTVELECQQGTKTGGHEKVLHFVMPPEEEANGAAAALRSNALSKLTPDERMALGLSA